jgi:hypothetical protein
MATITFTLASTGLNGSREFTLPEADVTRLINAFRAPAQREWDDKGETGAVTNGQILAFWARDIMRRTKQHIKDVESVTPVEIGVSETE